MEVEEVVRKCQKHFNYRDIVDEMQELIDYGSIVEFVVFELATAMLKDMDIDLGKLLKGEKGYE